MQELPIAFEDGRPTPKSSVLKVRQALVDLIGEKAVTLSEGLGRLVISTSREIKVPGYPQMPAGALASLTNLANEPTFRKIIADGRAARKRAIEAIGDVGDCAIVRKDKGGDRWKMILRDASEPGKWRTQSFDARGFSGHVSFATRELAIEDAATSGYSVRDDGALDRIQDSPAFQRGLFTTDLIRLINGGEITHSEGDRRLAAYDQMAQALHSIAEVGAQAFIASAGEIIYLLADRINEGAEQAVFLHEIVHRHGRSVLGQTGWSRVNRTLKGWSVQPVGSVERLIHDRALARAKAAAGASSYLLEEEFFAYSVEEAVTMGVKPSAAAHPESAEKWLDTVVTTFERIVSGILDGQPAKSMSAQQVVDMAYALAQIENPARMTQILERMTPQQRQVLEGVVARTAAPPWYSQLTRQVRQQQQDAMPAKQWIQWIKAQTQKGVKSDEVLWSGVLDWLDLQKGKVSRDAVIEYLCANGVQVQEVVMGERTQTAFTIKPNGDAFDFVGHEGGVIGTESSVSEAEELRDYYQDTYGEGFKGAQPKYHQYTLPGGSHYREVLLTLPDVEEALREKMRKKYPQWTGLKSHVEVMSKEDSAALDAVRSNNYKSSHWPDHLNVLAHIRMNDRIDASGKRVLFIDEIQSDWGQEGKKLGFGYKDKTPLTTDEDRELMELYALRANRTAEQTTRMHALNNRLNASQGKTGIPAAPFVTSTDGWLNLALKRIVKIAADGGYDRVAFISGEQSADRYRLAKGIQAVSFNPETGYFVAQPKGDQSTTVETGVTSERLAKLVGQDVAAKLMAAPLNDHGVHVLRDIDLTIGGNGMKVFYDTIVPNAVNALLKKTGGGRMAPIGINGMSRYPRSFPSQASAQEWADKNLGDHDFSVRGLSESEGTYGVYDEYDHKEVMGESTLSQPGFEVTAAMRETARMGMPLFSLETTAAAVVQADTERTLTSQHIRASFAGPRAATANTMALSNAKSRLAAGDDAEAVRQATGWHIGVDGKWRFEIHDGDARLLPAVKSLNQGGFEATPIDSITYCQNSDGTFDLTLNPPNPQTTRNFVTLRGITQAVVDAVLPDALTNAVLRGDGEDDWIGNFKDAKRLRQPFEFTGFNTLPLDQVISHPALFAAYPGLRTIHVQVDPRMGTNALLGRIGTDGHVIRMGVGQQLSSLIHEIQHGIQNIEGFASGGSVQTSDVNLPEKVVAQIKQISERADEHSLDGEFEEARALRAQISDIRKQFGYERYRALAGEVEARNAQARRNMTPAQRLATAPSATADTPDHELGISFNGQVMAGAPTPANARPAPAAPFPEPSPGTSQESIRASMARAYGPLFGRLERSGLVALAQSSRQAVNEAAAARAEVRGTTVSFERETLKQSIRQSLRAARTPGAKALLRGAADIKLSQSGQLQGFFDPVTGTSFLVADNLSIDTAPGVLIHEVGIHMASSAALEPLFERAADLLKTGAGTPFFDRVIERMRLAEETCPEEAAAYLAEEYEFDRMHAPKTVVSWMGDFKATVRAWLYLKGAVIQVENLGPADIAAVARANARSLVTCLKRETRLRHSIAAGRCASPWYSELARQVQALNQSAMPADQFAGWIKALTTKGVKPDEIEWSGVLDWLKLQQGKVSKADVLGFLSSNGVQIEEHVLGASPDIFSHSVVDWKGHFVQEFDDEDEANEYAQELQGQTDDPYKVKTDQVESTDGAQYGEYALDGGKNYRELLLTLPELPCKPVPYDALRRAVLKSKIILSLDEHAELLAMNGKREQSDFKSSHWENHPNVLAHVRLDDRIDAQGKRVLLVHELQSDWGQAGRKKGFRPADIEQQQEQYKAEMKALYPLGHNDRRRTPDEVARGEALDKAAVGAPIAPFVTSTDGWLSLALKRIIKLAADESYDKVAFISGEQSVDRYKLSNKINEIHWHECPDGKHVTVNFANADGLTLVVDPQGGVVRTDRVGPVSCFVGKLIETVIGKAAAEKITAQPTGSLSGDGLNIGGEGMRLFYDRIVPNMVKDMLRKLGGAPLESVEITQGIDRELLDDEGRPYVDKAPVSEQSGFTITEAMRRQVSGGMPLFGRAVVTATESQEMRTVQRA